MKLWNTNICLTSRKSIMVIISLFLSTLVIASVWPDKIVVVEIVEEETWIPTAEDIAYQDSMYSIIEQTQLDVDDIKFSIEGILYKLDRLYYEDGSWDSIRYVEGGVIDKALIKDRQ